MTSGFYAVYKAIFDKVKTDIATKTSIKAICLGEELRFTDLPLAIINPAQTTVEPETMGTTLQCKIGFSVVLVIRETEPTNWFADIIAVMADVFDAVVADPTLGGAVKDVYPTLFVPGEIRIQNKLFYGGAVHFMALLEYAP